LRELAPGQRRSLTVLALPDRRVLFGELTGGPAVDAVPGEIELSAGEPRGPLVPVGGVHDLLPPLGELEAEILDQRGPEPFGLLDRAAVELRVALEPEPSRQPGEVRLLDLLRR